MASGSARAWRRWTDQGGFWNILTWFGRSMDQLAGVLLNPLVVVIYARSLEANPTRTSWFIGAFGLSWAVGFALAPVLQRVTIRVMPWIVGGYVLRTASIVLLAYVVSERSASPDQRFRSALICYGAYALATGIARSSQSRHIIHGTAHGLWDDAAPITTFATQTLIAIGAMGLWSTLNASELPWSQAFGRVWYLAAIALGIATVAAIDQGARSPEAPRLEHGSTRQAPRDDDRRRIVSLAAAIAIGASAITFVEGLAFLAVFEDFRRQSIVVRSSVGFLAAGWITGTLIWGFARSRYTSSFLAQLALGVSMIGLLIALSLGDLAGGEWFPESILGTDSVHAFVYAMATLIGAGFAGRRALLNPIYTRIRLQPVPSLGLSLAGGIAPVVAAYLLRNLDTKIALGAGLGLCLLVVIALGTLDRSGVGRSPKPASEVMGSSYAPRHVQ